ncbi:MAG: hypothetical protein GY720_11015 [bacterium]|nr:hypothetical protein [bacterium]
MRVRSLVVSLGLIAAACSGGVVETTAPASPGGSSTAPSLTEAPGATEAPEATEAPGTTGATAETEAPRTDGTPAPGFVAVLSDGSEFQLGAHDKPVYLVFWAEW